MSEEEDTITIEISEDIVHLAKSTKPEGKELEDWILEWTKFGLEISGMASARKEALDIGANIEKAAVRKFAELVNEETVAFGVRLQALEDLTDLKDQEAGFGKLFKDLNDYVDPSKTQSLFFKYNELLGKVDDEDGLFRKAIRAELDKTGGVTGTLGSISTKLEIDDAEAEMRRKTTLKGDKFEDTLINVLEELCGSNELTFTKTKGQIGFAPQNSGNNKKGDIRIDFGSDHSLHDSPIVIEVKSDSRFYRHYPANPQISASHYLEKAMENRRSNFGIWVQDSSTAGDSKWPKHFTVSRDKIFVVWDEEDPSTDWRLLSAIYIAMGRIRPQQKAEDVEESEIVEELIGDLKLEAENFADMQKATATITARSKDLKGMLSKGSTRLYDCIKDAEKVLRMMQPDPDDMPDLPFEDSDSKAGEEES